MSIVQQRGGLRFTRSVGLTSVKSSVYYATEWRFKVYKVSRVDVLCVQCLLCDRVEGLGSLRSVGSTSYKSNVYCATEWRFKASKDGRV